MDGYSGCAVPYHGECTTGVNVECPIVFIYGYCALKSQSQSALQRAHIETQHVRNFMQR